ncbi:Branched-chain-amino-acid aminotransferase 2 [bioreactor metagenome]|uniref:Branched-chain-amino-acid aminotransferase 2 n=1 Tax=bioreactor metagenome TaxID=1076179 RepID=A0A645CF50_9ZZZZ
MEVNGFKTGELSQKLYDTIYGIQTGAVADTFGWTVEVK